MLKRKKLIYNFILIVFGLTPLLWFKPQMMLKTSDLRLPVSWEQWNNLLYVWNHTLAAGASRLLDTSLILFWTPSAILSKFGVSLIATQRIIFTFWFMLTAFCSYYMFRKLLTGKWRLLAALTATSFYLYNLWPESYWVGFKPPLVAGYAVLPVIIALIIATFNKEINYKKSAMYIALVSLVASSIGNNPSEFIGLIAPVVILFFYFFTRKKCWKEKKEFLFFAKFSGLTLLLFIICNSYWLGLQASMLWQNISSGVYASSVPTSLNWLRGISTQTSFLNVMRLQADWSWYGGCVDPYRSYSAFYRSNFIFLGLSYIAPLLACLGAIISKNKNKLYFIILGLIGIVLSMGAHFPFEGSYIWLVRNIPLFWIIRSPYFKFGLLICLAYSFLIGVACQKMCQWLERIKIYRAPYFFAAIIIIINITYAFPVSLGKMFHDEEIRSFLAADHVSVPDYVLDTANWLNSKEGFFRVYTVPGDSPWITSWNYVGYGSIIQNYIRMPVVFKYTSDYILYSQGAENQSRPIVEALEKSIFGQSNYDVAKMLALLNIKYVVQENDVRFDFYKGPGFVEGDSPEFMKNKLNSLKDIEFERSFGKWDVYKVNKEIPYIYSASKINLIVGTLNNLTPKLSSEFLDKPALLFTDKINDDHIELLKNNLVENLIINGNAESAARALENAREVLKKNSFQYLIHSSDIVPTLIDEPNIALNLEGFSKPEALFQNQTWRWITASNLEPNIILNNSTSENKYVNLKFLVYSYKRKRTLHLYLNEEALKIVYVPRDEATEVMIEGIKLKPGKNIIAHYSPDQCDVRNERKVRFALSDISFKGRKFTSKIIIPKDGNYLIRASWLMAPAARVSRLVAIDGKELKTSLNNDGKALVAPKSHLSKGTYNIEVKQSNQQDYYIEIIPISCQKGEIQIQPLEFTMINPTKYKINSSIKYPLIFFNESYGAAWQLYSKGADKNVYKHFETNGFSNGWYVDKSFEISDEHDIIISYFPQRLFIILALVSLLACLGCFFTLFILGRRSKFAKS